MKKRNLTAKKLPFAAACLIGATVCIVLILLSAALIGTLLINETIGDSAVGLVAKVLLFASVLIGTISALVNTDLPVIPISAVICVSIILIQLLMCAFSSEGLGVGAIINSIIILAGAAAGVAIRLKIKPKSKHIKKAYR